MRCSCAEGGSRTLTPRRELRPERSASANSATSASKQEEVYNVLARCQYLNRR